MILVCLDPQVKVYKVMVMVLFRLGVGHYLIRFCGFGWWPVFPATDLESPNGSGKVWKWRNWGSLPAAYRFRHLSARSVHLFSDGTSLHFVPGPVKTMDECGGFLKLGLLSGPPMIIKDYV